jgi:Tol biopolymer transport system component
MRLFSVFLLMIFLTLTGSCTVEPEAFTLPRAIEPVSGIAFVTERNGNRDIYLIQPDGTGLTTLFVSPKPDSDPAFSPDGTMLAFRSRRDGSSDIYIAADDFPGEQETLAWSPDVSTLVFGSVCTGNHLQLYLWNRESRAVTPLTEPGYNAFTPAYSPDGKWLAYSSDRDGSPNLFLINLETGDVQNLTRNKFTDSRPVWSSDSQWIAFTRNLGGNEEIFITSINGGEATNLTNSPGADLHPAWSPVP